MVANMIRAMLCLCLLIMLPLVASDTVAQCTMHTSVGMACTNKATVKIIATLSNISNATECCAHCLANTDCGAWTQHGTTECLLANKASPPGIIDGATCGSKSPLPPPAPPPPPPPPLPPLPPAPENLQVPSMKLEREAIMHDPHGFVRDPSSPIQDPVDGSWHAWAVWVDPKYGTEGWSGFIHHFWTKELNSTWNNDGLALNHSSDPLAFDHLGMCSPGAQYDAASKQWYLFYTGATPFGTTGFPPRKGGGPMDNLSAQGVAVSLSPFGPWKRLGVVAPGGLAWGPNGEGGGFRPGLWNGLRVDSGRAMIINGTKLYSTKGIGNGTKIPNSNPTGMYQALQGVFFPVNQSSWNPPYAAYQQNPVTRAGPTGNSYTWGGAENCEFFNGPDGYFHCVCSAHGSLYPGGSIPHYLINLESSRTAQPTVSFNFVGFVPNLGASEPTPVYENGQPGNAATVRYFIARTNIGISLYSVQWQRLNSSLW